MFFQVDNEDSDQSAWMHWSISVYTGRTYTRVQFLILRLCMMTRISETISMSMFNMC